MITTKFLSYLLSVQLTFDRNWDIISNLFPFDSWYGHPIVVGI